VAGRVAGSYQSRVGTRAAWGIRIDAARPARSGLAAAIILLPVAFLLLLAALAFMVGGTWLAWLGGSQYFLLAGLVAGAAGLLVLARDPLAIPVYALGFAGTAAWALWEVGLAFWPLMSRLYAPSVMLVALVAAAPLLGRGSRRIRPGPAFAIAALLALGVAVASAAAFRSHDDVRNPADIRILPVAPGMEQHEWRHFANGADGARFAALDQISRDNVHRLRIAWAFPTASRAGASVRVRQDSSTPIQVGDAVFFCTADNQVYALDAETGQLRWQFDPAPIASEWRRCRGVAYHGPPAFLAGEPVQDSRACVSRILLATVDARLFALDARDGRPCSEFGEGGSIDLRVGLGRIEWGSYGHSSPPLVAGELVIVGARIADNHEADSPGGVVRAFDVRTGALTWAFDPGNPDVRDLPPLGGTYSRGTPNAWAPMTYDAELGQILLPMANPAAESWGGNRSALAEAYGSAIVALDAASGRERWRFQTVHHDLWNYDVAAQPILHELPDERGGTTPAVTVTTKNEQIFVLDRRDGAPIARVEERRVPQGAAAGDRLSPTQPFSVGMPMLEPRRLRESDMWGLTPLDQLYCRIAFRRLRYEGMFTPPGTEPSLTFPSPYGGMNWSGGSVDKINHLLVVLDVRAGFSVELLGRAVADTPSGTGDHAITGPMRGTPFAFRRKWFDSPLDLPCLSPPHGRLSAIDLRTGRLVWQVPAGTMRDSGPGRWRSGLSIPIGVPTLGGPMITQSGLVFHGGTVDQFLRAYDIATGEELWKGRLPTKAQAAPMTYRSPQSGRQFVLINAGGSSAEPERGSYLIAFALR
jgi:quinate dehydrogenase (quinone)